MNDESKRKFVKRLIKIHKAPTEVEIIDSGNTIQVKKKDEVIRKLQKEMQKDKLK